MKHENDAYYAKIPSTAAYVFTGRLFKLMHLIRRQIFLYLLPTNVRINTFCMRSLLVQNYKINYLRHFIYNLNFRMESLHWRSLSYCHRYGNANIISVTHTVLCGLKLFSFIHKYMTNFLAMTCV